MNNQEKLFADIRQLKLRPRMMELLADGITRATIMKCLEEHKTQDPTPPHCPHKARKAITNAKYD